MTSLRHYSCFSLAPPKVSATCLVIKLLHNLENMILVTGISSVPFFVKLQRVVRCTNMGEIWLEAVDSTPNCTLTSARIGYGTAKLKILPNLEYKRFKGAYSCAMFTQIASVCGELKTDTTSAIIMPLCSKWDFACRRRRRKSLIFFVFFCPSCF